MGDRHSQARRGQPDRAVELGGPDGGWPTVYDIETEGIVRQIIDLISQDE
ncbi:MAG TPA: hypothetical protein VG317_10300 [Pseudonocardiaceae bacterium]|nr:hypothetical protein [Pseudonocardiaceae bacterium]